MTERVSTFRLHIHYECSSSSSYGWAVDITSSYTIISASVFGASRHPFLKTPNNTSYSGFFTDLKKTVQLICSAAGHCYSIFLMNYFGFRSVISIAAKACNSVSRRSLFTVSAALITLNALSRDLTLADACLPDTAAAKLFKVALEYHEDKYDGVIVDDQRLPRNRADFSSQLLYSLETWRATGKKGVWLKIPIDKLEYAATAIDFGFVCHHAEKDYLMLTHWLSEDENKLPPNASHQIGVGCVVVNQEGSSYSHL
jgi:Nudix hydrolase domain